MKYLFKTSKTKNDSISLRNSSSLTCFNPLANQFHLQSTKNFLGPVNSLNFFHNFTKVLQKLFLSVDEHFK